MSSMMINLGKSTLEDRLKRDLDLNERMVEALKEYWESLGHKVEYRIVYNKVLKVHEIRSDDFVNGLPKEDMSKITKSRLVF